MSLVVGSEPWLDQLCARINDSDEVRRRGSGWQADVGFAFVAEEGAPTHRVVLTLDDGECTRAVNVDEETFAQADVRLAAPCDVWQSVLDGHLEPMKSIVLKRLGFEGNLLLLLRRMPAAKAVIECAMHLDGVLAGNGDASSAGSTGSAEAS